MPPAPPTGVPDRWLLIDAMNVVGSRPDGWWHDRRGAIADLVDQVRQAAPRLDARRITVVADGRGEDEPAGTAGVEVRWAGGGPDAADDLIVELVAAGDLPATVVTADRRLRDRAAALGAAVDGPRAFRARIEAVDVDDDPSSP